MQTLAEPAPPTAEEQSAELALVEYLGAECYIATLAYLVSIVLPTEPKDL